MQAGIRLASDFPGFLGAGWVRPTADSDEWHLLYRFDGATTLHDWDSSQQRAWWLGAGLAAGLAVLSKYSSLFLAPGVLLWLLLAPGGLAERPGPQPRIPVERAASRRGIFLGVDRVQPRPA